MYLFILSVQTTLLAHRVLDREKAYPHFCLLYFLRGLFPVKLNNPIESLYACKDIVIFNKRFLVQLLSNFCFFSPFSSHRFPSARTCSFSSFCAWSQQEKTYFLCDPSFLFQLWVCLRLNLLQLSPLGV